ncbi:MAG: alcohol dehydrogenase catalytic domain-containing protein, partial [Planctomycetota bacterium]
MQAAVFDAFGEPSDVLHCRERPEPDVDGKAVVRMLASPVNPSDLMTVRGVYSVRPDPPAVPGYEGVGVVESGGGLLGRFHKGKRVAVLNAEGGNWAEKVAVPANSPAAIMDIRISSSILARAKGHKVRDVFCLPSAGANRFRFYG